MVRRSCVEQSAMPVSERAVRHLEPLHGGLRRLAVHAVARAGKIAQIAKPLLHIAHRFAGTAHL